jgi:hypothetical protein
MNPDLVEALLVIGLSQIPKAQDPCDGLASMCESSDIGEAGPSGTTEPTAETVLVADIGLPHDEAREDCSLGDGASWRKAAVTCVSGGMLAGWGDSDE